MALHLTPDEHDNDPPQGWTTAKSKRGRLWRLLDRNGGVIGTFTTKKDAESAKSSGFCFDLYTLEGRWFKGDTPQGWKPYACNRP